MSYTSCEPSETIRIAPLWSSQDKSESQLEFHGPKQPVTQRQAWKAHFKTLLFVVLNVVALFVFIALVLYSKQLPSSQAYHSLSNVQGCGNSIAEATANGCVLDMISRVWTPPECHDAELTKEFLTFDDWHWYDDEERTKELSLEEVQKGGGSDPIIVSFRYHLAHCAFLWRKLHRAYSRGTPLDEYTSRYGHTEHCSSALVNHGNVSDDDISHFTMVYTYCLEF